jgi:hypothetical protein
MMVLPEMVEPVAPKMTIPEEKRARKESVSGCDETRDGEE